MLRIGIVAGEASGDLLGAGLIAAIKARVSDVVFEGVAGPAMIEQGCTALFPAERLSVMGLVEVLAHYRELHAMRSQMAQHFIQHPPDVFIGIDVPDFNLGLEQRLKAAGIPTVQYVSPSVWAWRQYRIRKIARSVDLMLTLFPFESAFYRRHRVAVEFVGHPLADMIPFETDRAVARQALGLPLHGEVVALLPGSRVTEVGKLAADFVEAAAWCLRQLPGLHFVVPLVNQSTRRLFEQALATHAPELPVTMVNGRSREAMAAADVVLLASGTATLEALLLKKPMVVAYRLAPLTYWIAKALLRIDHYALPNLLSDRGALVPEFIQQQVTPVALGQAIVDYLERPEKVSELLAEYRRIHAELRQNASESAAQAVLALINK